MYEREEGGDAASLLLPLSLIRHWLTISPPSRLHAMREVML